MDKQTISNYGWIVVLVLILSVLLAFASPFGKFIATAVQSTTQGLFDVNQEALGSAGIEIMQQEFENMLNGSNADNAGLVMEHPYIAITSDGIPMVAIFHNDGTTTLSAMGETITQQWKYDNGKLVLIDTDSTEWVSTISQNGKQFTINDNKVTYTLSSDWNLKYNMEYIPTNTSTMELMIFYEDGSVYLVINGVNQQYLPVGTITCDKGVIYADVSILGTGETGIAAVGVVTGADEINFEGCILNTNPTEFAFGITISNKYLAGYTDGMTEWTIPATITLDTDTTVGGKTYRAGTYKVVSIDNAALQNCTSLTSIHLPYTLTYIDQYYSFGDCSNLVSVTVDENSEHFISVDGILFSKDMTTLWEYPAKKTGTTYNIPNTVTTIINSAFNNCENLQYINFSASVADIDIESGSSHDGNIFHNCTGLIAITVDQNNETFCSVDGILFSKDMTTLIAYPQDKTGTTYNIPNSVTHISDTAFKSSNHLTTVNIPNSVVDIGWSSFEGCILTSVVIPDSVTHIGIEAFANCANLQTATIGNSVEIIGTCAFQNCTNLISIVLPESVSIVSNGLFEGCTNLQTISIPKTATRVIYGALRDCKNLTSIIFQGSVTEWEAIEFGKYWNGNTGNYVVHCIDGHFTKGSWNNSLSNYNSVKATDYACALNECPSKS